MNITEKILAMSEEKTHAETIVVTHITIRQSIFFLVLKLFVLEFFAAAVLVAFYFFVIIPNTLQNFPSYILVLVTPIFLLLVVFKSLVMVYVIILWLEEYYEINTNEVFHRKGFIIKKEERFTLDHIGSLKIDQDILGRIFNYGTLKLYDWASERDVYLYLIHNPLKYYKILQNLLPNADVEKKVFRTRLIDKEDD